MRSLRRSRAARLRLAAPWRVALLVVLLLAAGPGVSTAKKKPKPPPDPALALAAEHAQLIRRHRPDLAERWAAPIPDEVLFEPLDVTNAATHERALRSLASRAGGLPATPAADSLRNRLELELAQTAPGGALHTDALLWLGIVEAAARLPFAYDSTAGCREVDRSVRQLERIPEALRGAAVMMRGAPPPEPEPFEAGLTRTERVFRHELPRRTKACKEGRLLAEFVEADSLAAASLAGFRRLLLPGP
jgi:hypothetical protein